MFEGIVGQEGVKDLWQRSLNEGRVVHAYLLIGPDGIGKSKCAGAMATSLVAEKDERALKLAADESHPDILKVAAEKDVIKIDQIREAINYLRIAPVMSKRKAVIISNAHQMNTNAANALLRILEEPPASRHIFLVTDRPNALPVTVRSRCQKVVCTALKDDDVLAELKSRGFDKKSATDAARLAEGSLGRALNIDTEVMAEVQDFLNSKTHDLPSIIATAESWSRDYESGSMALLLLGMLCRQRLRESAGTVDEDKWLKCLKFVSGTQSWWTSTANKRLLFEQLLMDISKTLLEDVNV